MAAAAGAGAGNLGGYGGGAPRVGGSLASGKAAKKDEKTDDEVIDETIGFDSGKPETELAKLVADSHPPKSKMRLRLDSRDALVTYLKSECGYLDVVGTGSHVSHLAVNVQLGDFDFDLYCVVAKAEYIGANRDALTAPARDKIRLYRTNEGQDVSPEGDILKLESDIKAYPRAKQQPSSDSMCVTWKLASRDLTYELLPALVDKDVPHVLYVPYGHPHADAYQVVFPALIKARILEMDSEMPGIRNCIRILKVLRSLLDWKIESFAITCAMWHRRDSLVTLWRELARGKTSELTTKLRYAALFLSTLLQREYIPHMFSGSFRPAKKGGWQTIIQHLAHLQSRLEL